MNNSTRHSIMTTFLFFLCVLAVSCAVNRLTWVPPEGPILEGVLLFFIFAFLFSRKSVANFWTNLPRLYQIFFTVFFFCMVSSQLMSIPRTTFPFIPWRMFSETDHRTTALSFQYVGQDPTGREVTVNPPKLFPSLSHSRLSRGLRQRTLEFLVADDSQTKKGFNQKVGIKKIIHKIRSLVYIPDRTSAELKQQMNDALRTIGKMHNRKHPDQKIETLTFIEHTRNLYGPPDQNIRHQAVWQVNIEGDALP